MPLSTKYEMRGDLGVVRNYGRLLVELAGVVPDGLVGGRQMHGCADPLWRSFSVLPRHLLLALTQHPRPSRAPDPLSCAGAAADPCTRCTSRVYQVCFFVSYLYMDSIISKWHDMGILQELMAHKLVFIETQVGSFVWCLGGQGVLARELMMHKLVLIGTQMGPFSVCFCCCRDGQGGDQELVGWVEGCVVIDLDLAQLVCLHVQDVVETTLALDNFRRACDSGRGAVFLSVARGKVRGVRRVALPP